MYWEGMHPSEGSKEDKEETVLVRMMSAQVCARGTAFVWYSSLQVSAASTNFSVLWAFVGCFHIAHLSALATK